VGKRGADELGTAKRELTGCFLFVAGSLWVGGFVCLWGLRVGRRMYCTYVGTSTVGCPKPFCRN